MRVSTKSVVVFLLLMYMTLLSLNGIVTVVAYMSTRALLLYKDFFAMAVPLFVLILLFARNPRVTSQCRSILILFLSMVIFSLVFILLSMLSGRFDFFRAIVQFRLELLTFGAFFFAAVLLLFEYSERVEIVTKVIKYYIIFAVLNALFAVAESSMAGLLYAVVGFDPGPQFTQFGKEYGLLLRTIQGQLRAFGLLTGPFSLSEYLFFALILVPFVSVKHRKKYIVLIMLGIAFSTSKTAIIMALLYIMYLMSRRFFSLRFSLNIVTMVTMVLSLFFYVTTTNYSIYEMIFPKENSYAENSILLRTVNIEAVRADSGYSPFIGAGYAVNGNAVVGDDNTNSVPLDSMYIYMLSNYGNVGIVFLIIVATVVIGLLYQRTLRGLNPGIYLYWMISLSMNFVYNNPLSNYPGYIFPIIITILLLSVRKPESSTVKRSVKNLGHVHPSH
ncbi:hypothetical protein R6Y99_14650 [Pseudomonas lundensis]|uniref:hypothetical protein n=1 Tax=Serratia proteamaculans TaxID=28151 RepID=UPI0029814F6E|nr:hypothetical protein [Serratia proteamaculans]MDW5501028.1 hypothetical protein [Serratia proteamaculans]MDW5506092.1 hypothetical protein [Pseudomonas lundensis]